MKRFIRFLIAKLFRTFVTDCPRCYRHFFGFQAYEEQVNIQGTHYRIVCHHCATKRVGHKRKTAK